ncbi:MAG: MiaB/RimO family radical SAM methylthiotransferase [Candidatus Omnitrophica bacterium]|nr:MiaB/RimO family radical SAM methylthiotransferase [Candidatus Omnitrophota bacterium]
MQTIKFFTLGCKVNQYETQAIREHFLKKGFTEISNGLAADVYVINTCTVTHKADAESFNLIRRFRRQNPKAKIIVTGCLTKLDSNKILALSPGISVIKDKTKIMSKTVCDFKGRTRAFLKIQDGCNNHCSYCKVPLVRGRSKSRPLAQVIKEARLLVNKGFKEIVLTGICLGSYGRDFKRKIELTAVIKALEEIEGLSRIRLSSIEAGDVSDALIDLMRRSKKLCHHLHIPVQSGDDKILKKMNRRYCRATYLSLIKKLKKKIPDIGITTDVLVGFPGETEENFQNTVDLINEIEPLKVHIFPYSKREGTVASLNNDGLSDPYLVQERMRKLACISDECARKFRRRFLNKKLEVLVEARKKTNPDIWHGYASNYLRAEIKSEPDISNMICCIKLRT